MAVAVKSEAEVGKGLPALGLASASLVATAYLVIGCLAVYHGIPFLYDLGLTWWMTNVTSAINLGSFMYEGAKLLLIVLAAGGLIWLWPRVFKEQAGLRAGAAIGAALVLLGLVVAYFVTWLVCRYALAGAEPATLYWGGLGAVVVTGAIWLGFMVTTFGKQNFQARLVEIEEQGWFTLKPYKKGQGLRCRRGTMIGVLAIIGAGLWVYAWSRSLTISTQWQLDIPFDPQHYLVLMYAPMLTASVLIAILGMWFAYRLVNYPRFADFLIATDAELNKVSWSTRKRLFQDTIVVLTTVILMAVFLLLMDLLWTLVLKGIGVIHS
jgi:preprotein translocase SecE subunit